MNNLIITIIIFLFGLIIGSFLNVVILRFDALKSIIDERSHCLHCKKTIAWYDLVPLLSFVLLLGRCRNCKEKISWQYPLVEAGTAIIFTALFWHFGLSLEFFALLIVSAILIVVFTYDYLHMLIADGLIWLGLAVWIIHLILDYFLISHSFNNVFSSFYGALILGLLLGFLVLAGKEKWMGKGDIGLGILIGAVVGWPAVIITIMSAFILGSIVGVVLIIIKIKSLKDAVPFAPFLIIALFLTLFWGEKILSWYLQLIGL